MPDPAAIERIRRKHAPLRHALDERSRRLWAATEARKPERAVSQRIRRAGGGRKAITRANPALLEALVAPTARGGPDSALRWTIRSTRVLAETLTQQGHTVSHATVGTLLDQTGFSLQANRKTREGKSHPDRNAQFEYIHRLVQKFQTRRQPVISVDAKKKEPVGGFRNGGREYRRHDNPVPVRAHDSIEPQLGKAIPYGVYDLANHEGRGSVGIAHDTADSGGSNAARTRLWKVALQILADATGLTVTVGHSSQTPASGTRSSPACFPSSPGIGGAIRSSPCKPLSS